MARENVNIARLLQESALRATRPRKAVLNILADADGPLEAKEVYARLARVDANASVATVYRVLGVLEKTGIVQRRPHVAGNTALFHLPDGTKGQVVCSRCGKVEEFDIMPEMQRLSEEVSKQSRFATTDQSLYIIAGCRNSNDKQCD